MSWILQGRRVGRFGPAGMARGPIFLRFFVRGGPGTAIADGRYNPERDLSYVERAHSVVRVRLDPITSCRSLPMSLPLLEARVPAVCNPPRRGPVDPAVSPHTVAARQRWRRTRSAHRVRTRKLGRRAQRLDTRHFRGLESSLRSGRSAAWLARVIWDHEVGGSNPLAPTIIEKHLRPPSRWLFCVVDTFAGTLTRIRTYGAAIRLENLAPRSVSLWVPEMGA